MRLSSGIWIAAVFAACGPNPNTDPGYAGHSIYLPLLGTSHDPSGDAGITCDSCHGAFTTFTQYTCTAAGCHPGVDAQHSGVPGYDGGYAPCVACHYQTPHTLFPIGDGTKHSANCGTCHLAPNNPADLNSLQCDACHAPLGVDVKHAAIQDYQTTSPLCLRCHDQSVVTRVADHPSGRSTFLGNDNHPEKCLKCHEAVLPTPMNSAGTTWAADWRSTPGCTTGGCHPNGVGGGQLFPRPPK